MRVWIDLANSPHVPLFAPVVDDLRGGGWEVVLTARDHAQTLGLATAQWPDVTVVGGESPGGRRAKGQAIGARAAALRRFAKDNGVDVALSHGSYAQIVAAFSARVPAVTMMDYEYQPANHLSFRIARRVIVPDAFPARELRRCGARPRKTLRYAGFKEELYLAGFRPDPAVLGHLGVEEGSVLVVMRAPPDGALYHREANARFDELLERARGTEGARTVLLPRTREQHERYGSLAGITVPDAPVDGQSLLALADLVVGGGGTMSRESALLGTPTYTVFAGRLAAVDAALIAAGRLHDLRDPAAVPRFERKRAAPIPVPLERREPILAAIRRALDDATARSRRRLGGAVAVAGRS